MKFLHEYDHSSRIILSLLLFLTFSQSIKGDCFSPLGLIDGRIKDWQLSSSSFQRKDARCHPKFCRIYSLDNHAWCPDQNKSGEFLQIDLGTVTNITGIQTQGRADGKHWVRSFYILYSEDAVQWQYHDKKRKLLANQDSISIATTFLPTPISTRFLRVEIAEWEIFPALRLELLGCQRCNKIINYKPRTVYHASSSRAWGREKGCYPEEAFIDGATGWCSKWNNHHQWLSVDIGPPTKIVGVITRGRGGVKNQWVTAYTISYSNDSKKWTFFNDEDNTTLAKEFGGNMDSDTRRWHYFTKPFVARFIRFNPVSWKNRIGMRVGIIGCLYQGPCTDGFVRVNNHSECLLNLAFQRPTWINDKRQSWSQWTYGHSDLAVDGRHDSIASLNKCAILDNYFVDVPMWMVDLGEAFKVNGVVIFSWSEHYSSQNYLGKLIVSIANVAKLGTNDTSVTKECGQISFEQLKESSKIHVPCQAHVVGQYVYITAYAKNEANQMLFSAILCEVFVY